MRYILILTLLLNFSFASLLDFHYLSNAKEAYEKKEYESASKIYGEIAKDGNDEAKFNLANSLYRQKKYKESIEVLDSINSKELSFKKFHNIGNSYANMNKIDEAIKAYEKALSIKEDEDTKYNLELLKKKKEEQKDKDKKENKDNKQDNKQNKENQNQQDKKNQDNQKQNDSKKDEQKQDNKSNQEQKDKQQNSSKDDKKQKNGNEKKAQNEKDKDKQEDEKRQQKEQKAKKDKENKKDDKENRAVNAQIQNKPISDMEERKWQKMLNQRGVNTLMLPLNSKGDKKDETNPW